jgi:periplasmic protein CpxP/Spy
MKKALLSLFLVACVGGFSAIAQGGFQQRPIEERVKNVMEKLAPLNLDKTQTAETDSIFTNYYKAADKAIEDMRSSGSFDRDVMMAKRKELSDARDEKLKKTWNADQFKKFKDEIEATLRPQRQGGGGNK